MDARKGPAPRNRNIFKGSVLLSLLVESHPRHFPSRAVAYKFARRLQREGHLRSVTGSKDFQDSAQLYIWQDQEPSHYEDQRGRASPSASPSPSPTQPERRAHRNLDLQLIEDIRNKLLNRSEAYNIVASYNTFFQELEQDFGYNHTVGSASTIPPGNAGQIDWSNKPFTSTLESKKDTRFPADSSGNNPSSNKASSQKRTVQQQVVNPEFNGDSALGASNRVNNQQPNGKSGHQRHSKPSHKHHSKPQSAQNLNQLQTQSPHEQGQKTEDEYSHHALEEDTKQPARIMNSDVRVGLEQRLVEAYHVSDLAGLSPGLPDYQDVMEQQDGLSPSFPGFGVGDDDTNRNQVNADATKTISRTENQAQNHHSLPHPKISTEMKNWLEQGVFSTNKQWTNDMNRPDSGGGAGGGENNNPARWESLISDGADSGRRWRENAYSYSDNEKQLLEEMRRMKKEHQTVLRTYESRINKLMAKMHELRSIAEMLEHSSNKSSPYGVLPGKLTLLNILGGKDGKKHLANSATPEPDQAPPPLPPRPNRGTRVIPNKPIIHASVALKSLPWSRIILENTEQENTIWNGLTEAKVNTEDLERLFTESADISSDVNLYDDVCLRRGRNHNQIVSIYDSERSQRITAELKVLYCKLPDIVQAFVTLNCDELYTDSFAELLELITSPRELDKIVNHVKKRGAAQLDAPEFLVYELSRVDHFRERLEFLRFKNKIQINLFEIDQQLRELQTACEEITTSSSLQHVLEVVLSVGNQLNAGTDRGQADGFQVQVLNSLKDIQDISKQCNLLEVIMRSYCISFEADVEFGCPTRFRLPEPSNMRHAAQVSFEDINRALKELKEELGVVKNKLQSLSKQEETSVVLALRSTIDNFMTSALEALSCEQKLLEDTRIHFRKAAAFFSYSGQKTTPQDFFQIWAAFLHDCKYYWKLAHRNLAKEKFNADLNSKSQMSNSSLPEFQTLKSSMMKQVVSLQRDNKTRSDKSQQLQHINSWIQSVGRYTMEMQIDDLSSPLNSRRAPPNAVSEERQDRSRPRREMDSAAAQNFNRHTGNEKKDPFHSPASNARRPEPENIIEDQPISSSNTQHPPHPVSNIEKTATSETLTSDSGATNSQALPSNQKSYKDFDRTTQPFVPAKQMVLNLQPNFVEKEDNMVFEPLYESLSQYSHTQADYYAAEGSDTPQAGLTDWNNAPGTLQNGLSDMPNSSHTVPTDPETMQRKNARFFKSLLKADHRKGTDQATHNIQTSPLKNFSTPFSKVKNTFVQKFSSGGHSKHPQTNAAKEFNCISEDPNIESSDRLSQVLPRGSDSLTSVNPSQQQAAAQSNNPVENMKDQNDSNYQNVCFPEQSRSIQTPDSLEVHADHTDKMFFRDGHESFPSTVSSFQSIRDKDKLNYQGNLLHRNNDFRGEQEQFRKQFTEDRRITNKNLDYFQTNPAGAQRSTPRSSRARARAPLVLGSNVSISDAYSKNPDNAQNQNCNLNSQIPNTDCVDTKQEKASLGSLDSKMVKASPVPVYKAKTVQNYENQSKFESHYEAGARGSSEAVHKNQTSINSSDVYRQELQKRSESVLTGNVCSPAGQGGGSRSHQGRESQGASVLPSRPHHYHAVPITLSHNNQRSRTSQEEPNPVHSHQSSRKAVNEKYPPKQNHENNEFIPSLDHNAQHSIHNHNHLQSDFIVISGSKFNTVNEMNYFPLDFEKDRRVSDRRVPGARSSSAHSIYDNTEYRRQEKMVSSTPTWFDSQQQAEQQRMSRRDLGGTKTTPTSNRDPRRSGAEAPQSVTTLIDRFERGTDGRPVGLGLLEISDKPPSMTSTPVVRRKNPQAGGSRNHQGNTATRRPEGESVRSRSEGPAKSHNQKDILAWQQQPVGQNLVNHKDFNCQASGYSHFPHDEKGNDLKSWTLPRKPVDYGSSHSGKIPQATPDKSCTSRYDQRMNGKDPFNSASLESKSVQNQTAHSSNYPSDTNNKISSRTSTDQQKSETSHQQPHSVHTVSNQSLPVKPKAQHPFRNVSGSSESQQSLSQSQADQDLPTDHPQFQSSELPGQAGPLSSFSQQRPPGQSFNSLPPGGNVQNVHPNYPEGSLPIFKSPNSAFEPLKSGSKYGRQPGAMAVVKPTVINI